MKKLIAILIFTTLISCKREVIPTPLPSHIFSPSESDEIGLMLKEFESVICDADQSNITKCYQAQFRNYDKYFKKGTIKVKTIENNEINRILKPLSQNTTSKLFLKQVTPYQDLRQAKFHKYQGSDSIRVLHINEYEIYLSLIKELGTTRPKLSSTINSIVKLNGSSFAAHTHSILLSGSTNNYNQTLDRLILAMHFIAINSYSNETTTARDIISKPLTDKLKARSAEREAKKKTR